jgi:hypothetical protein
MKIVFVCTLLCFSFVKGTLTPDGIVALDCGSQQIFTCKASGPVAVWTIHLEGGNVQISTDTGITAASQSSRISTNATSGNIPTSVVTIRDFSEADNNGTVQCIDQNTNRNEGTAVVVVGKPSCVKIDAFIIGNNYSIAAVKITWPPSYILPVTSTLVRYCPKTSPNCSTTDVCTQGRGTGCIVEGLDPSTEYVFTVTTSNNCGSATGCTENVAIAKHEAKLPGEASQTTLSLLDAILVGVIPTVILLLTIVVSVVVVHCLTRHCCTNTSKANHPKQEAYEQVEPKTYEGVSMTSNPSYEISTIKSDVRMMPNPSYERPATSCDVKMTTNPSYTQIQCNENKKH